MTATAIGTTIFAAMLFATGAAAAPAPAASIALPGSPPVGMDYLAYDAGTGRVWVPAGNTGNVDVVDVVTGKLTPLGGFATKLSSRPGRPARQVGPSSVTVGDGAVWIGNRGDGCSCAPDRRSLAKAVREAGVDARRRRLRRGHA